METGMMISAKERMAKRKLNTIRPLSFSQLIINQFRKAAMRQTNKLRLTILGIPSTPEKSASVIK